MKRSRLVAITSAAAFLLLASAGACGDSGEDTDATGETTAETDPSAGPMTMGETGMMGPGFAISGTAVDLFTGEPYMSAAGSVCVSIVDPVPTMEQGEAVALASTELMPDGKFMVTGIMSKPEFGLVILVHDCDNSGTIVSPSASGMRPIRYMDLADGDELPEHKAWVLDVDTVAGTDMGLMMAGSTATIATDGAVIGYIRDMNKGGVPGASISCGGCPTVYYGDDFHEDGIFQTMGAVNTETSSTGLFIVPGAPAASEYTVTHPDLNFMTYTLGALPGTSLTVLIDPEM